MSDIRVSVQWKNSTVFAGDETECRITFKNAAPPRNLRRSPSPSSRHGSSRERWKETLPLRTAHGAPTSSTRISTSILGLPHPNTRSHRPALSLSTSVRSPVGPKLGIPEAISRAPNSGKNKHGRSVSIVSIGGDTIDEASSPGPMLSAAGRPVRGHARAASLQVLPRRTGISNMGVSSGT